MSKKKSSSTFWQKLKRFLFILILANIAYIAICKWVNPPITAVMIASLLKGNGLQKEYLPYSEMGKNCKLAVICSEDQLFPDHNGFDVDAIKKAIKYNKDPKHKKVLGASTISQQVAKNVFLWNGRNWLRKGLEVYHTFMIEWIWGKKRILETYLNVAEMGKGIFGIQAAARHYFKKDAKDLSKNEAAWIAAILPNPIVFHIKNPAPIIVRKHQWILRQMNNLEDDPETMKVILNE
ncbi:MAG: monofunctional biosynthetic peptidoglycan transglycosylase [Bacteroidetes bacterium]|nr:monofunctional biosynthetic peptidoglycan transglycosylase [Bacteroidota bacterium]